MKYLATFLLLALTAVAGYLMSLRAGPSFPLVAPFVPIIGILLAAALTAILLGAHREYPPGPPDTIQGFTPNQKDDFRFVFFIYLQTLTCGLQASAFLTLTSNVFYLAAIPPLLASLLASLIAIPLSLLTKPTPWKTPSRVFALLHCSFLFFMFALFAYASTKPPSGYPGPG